MNNSNSSINLVTGGAGFLGSHLIDHLLNKGEEVICVDNYFTGRKENIEHWIGHPKFELIRHDIVEPIYIEVNKIWHLACPASPIQYKFNPIKTSKTCFIGTLNMLGLARRTNSKMLLASSSEIYGDPLLHPQKENYRGNVNPIGIRSCYDEGKRIAESLCFDYFRQNKTDIKVMRIFNTYGPRMFANDGRVVSNFILNALKNKPLNIYGEGNQTRSFCFVDDLIDGMTKFMESDLHGPINFGNTSEITIKELAKLIINKINPDLYIVHEKLPGDDPAKRNPNIDLAKELLKWEPKVSLDDGIDLTIDFFKNY